MKCSLKHYLLVFFLVVSKVVFSFQQKDPNCQPYPYSRVGLKHREHKGVGWDKGYSTLSLFLAPRNNHVLIPFFDARFHAFNDGYIASNLGAGARFAPISDNVVVGFNTYYDFREYKSFSSHQASGGLEILTSVVDFRINGYYPFSGKTDEKDAYFHKFKKNSAYLRQDILYSLPSADAEIGFELPEPFKQVHLYMAFGSYYLFKTHAQNHAIGNAMGYKARLTATPEDYISFGVEYTHDRLFNNRVNGYISFQVPLGKKTVKAKSKSKYYKHRKECDAYYIGMERKTQDPYHNEIIPFYDETFSYDAYLNNNRIKRRFIFVNNTNLDSDQIGSGSGTFEDPYTTLKLGEINSDPADIIYVFYGRGNDDGYNKGFIFKNKQLLTSSSIPLEADGLFIPAVNPGKDPLVTNQLASTSHTIFADGLDDIVVQGFNLTSATLTPVYLSNSSASIKNNNISSLTGIYSFIHQGTKDSLIAFNFFSEGLKIEGTNVKAQNYSIIGNTIHTSSKDGLELINPSITTSIFNNNFISKSLTNSAINYLCNDTQNNTTTVIYRNNLVNLGFLHGIKHQHSIKTGESASFLNNQIYTSLNSGIEYQSSSQNGSCLITENVIRLAESGILISCLSDSDLSVNIEKNNLSSSTTTKNHITIKTQSKGKASISNNTLSNGFNGIYLENSSPNFDMFSFQITENKINVVGDGICVFNMTNSFGSSYGTIEQNQVVSTSGTNTCIGVELYPSAYGNICSTIIGNIGNGEGDIGANQDTTSIGEIVLKFDPPLTYQSLLSQNPGFSSGYFDCIFSPTTSPCPQYYPTIYVNNTNINPSPNGSINNPYPTLKQAQDNSKVGDIIYVFPGDGTTKGYDQGIVLKAQQTIASPAVTFTANGITIPGDGSRPPKLTASQGAVITAADKTKIIGLDIIPNINVNGIIISDSASEVAVENNEFLINGDSNAAIIFDANVISIENNSFNLKSKSQGIVHEALTPFTTDANISIQYNTFLSDTPAQFLGDAYLDIDGSNSNVNLVFDFSNNINTGTQKNFLLLGSNATSAISLNNNAFDNSVNPLFISSLKPMNFQYVNNKALVTYDASGVEFTNQNPSKVTNFSNNTFISKDKTYPKCATFNLEDNLCLESIAQNKVEQYSYGGFIEFRQISPALPSLNFVQTQQQIKNSNATISLETGSLSPTYGSPCP